MKITEIKYTYRFNKGNYEHEEISATAQVEVDALKELETLKSFVHSASRDVPDSQMNLEESVPSPLKEESNKTESESKTKKDKKSKLASKKEETQAVTTPEENSPVTEPENITPPVEEEVSTPEEPKAPKKTKTKFSVKAEVYDRENQLHKSALSEFLDKEFKGWRNNVAPYKKVSIEMEGAPFFDDNSEILESFKEAFKAKL